MLADQLDADWQTFIQLQVASTTRDLSEEEQRAHDVLLQKNRVAWMGPLAPWIVHEQAKFRHGFVWHAHAKGGAEGSHPAWRSVHQLFAVDGATYGRMNHLRIAGTAFWEGRPIRGGLGLISVQLAAIPATVPWKELQLELLGEDRGALAEALRRLDAPDLARISVRAHAAPPEGLFADRRLRELRVSTPRAHVALWASLAQESGASAFTLLVGPERWRLVRTGGAWCTCDPMAAPLWDALADVLGGLARAQ